MAKMKLLQPEMEKLRERYKDDRAKMQQELMALYREKKINPMAGCLPILLQIPVFFALYKVLYLTIDMRQAPFFGWIKDLSAPDPTSIFNLFGLLPYATPEFLHVGVWPIVMGITMWVQMQLNPQQPDPMQQKIFNWMPVMFTFLLANFASGLVIYWAWNNLLSLSPAVPHHEEERRRDPSVEEPRGRQGDRAAPVRRQGAGGGELIGAGGGASVRRGVEGWRSRRTTGRGRWRSCSAGRSLRRGAGSTARAAQRRPRRSSRSMTREQALRTLGWSRAPRRPRSRPPTRRARAERQPERLGEAEPGARRPARQQGASRCQTRRV